MNEATPQRPETTPTGKAVIKTGILSVVLAAIFEIGCLGYYGSGLSSEPSALGNLKTGAWSPEVRCKLQTLYLYYFLSMYLCVLSAALVYVNPFLTRTFSHPAVVVVEFAVHTLVHGGKAFAVFRNEGLLSSRKMIWVAYCLFLGGKACPALIFPSEIARIAVHMTSIIVFALIALALVAPVDKYASCRNVLNACELAFFGFSIGAAVYPIWTTLGAIFFCVNFYGGLVLYPINFLRHTQEAHLVASQDSGENSFCAVAAVVPMILDVISIFNRVVVLVPPV